MDREKLESLCYEKIFRELKSYKSRMMKKTKEEIYSAAYEIDSLISIYELMIEMINNLEEDYLETILVFPNLLLFLYSKWLKCEDSHVKELLCCIKKAIVELRNNVNEECIA